jgi:hypothetical protein
MKHYAGLDVSLDETSVCIVDEAGAYVAEAKVASDPAALADYLQATGLSFGRGRPGSLSPLAMALRWACLRLAFLSFVSKSGGRRPPSPR